MVHRLHLFFVLQLLSLVLLRSCLPPKAAATRRVEHITRAQGLTNEKGNLGWNSSGSRYHDASLVLPRTLTDDALALVETASLTSITFSCTVNSMSSIGLQEEIRVGDKVVLSSDSPAARYGVVFEDDGTVGYLYGIEFSDENHEIVDAMYIYNVSSVINRDKPLTIQIVWSEDGSKSALLIDDYPHAVFDFANHQGFCRTNFPSPSPNWKGHEWSDQALESF